MKITAFDTETFNEFFCLCSSDGQVTRSHKGIINISELAAHMTKLFDDNDIVASYNGYAFDLKLIAYILNGHSSTKDVKNYAEALIANNAEFISLNTADWKKFRTKHFDVLNGYKLGKSLKHWELYNGWTVRETDVPFDYAEELTKQQEDSIIAYCFADCEATKKLAYEGDCVKEIEVRRKLINDIVSIKGEDFPFDYPKAKLAEEWIYAEDDFVPEDPKGDATKLVPWELFNVPQDLKDLLMEICSLGGFKNYKQKHGIKEGEKVLWNQISYGEGGAHYAKTGTMFIDVHFFDVASLYPSLLIWLHMWKTDNANRRYEKAYTDRLAFKHSGDKFNANSLKLVLNAPTGKFRQQSFCKSQDMATGLAMCIIGQLIVTEAALAASNGDINKIVEVNTDSFAVCDEESIARAREYCKHTREKFPTVGFEEEVKDGENEHGIHSYFSSVNAYIDYFADGSFKMKGEDGSDLNKKKHEPIVIRSLVRSIDNDKVELENSFTFEDYIFKYSKAASTKNATIGGKPMTKKHYYFLWTTQEVGEDINFTVDRVSKTNGLVSARHGVWAFNAEDLRPYFKYVDRNQYEEDLKQILYIWRPSLVPQFKEMFRSKRQKSKRDFINHLGIADLINYNNIKTELGREKFLKEKGWIIE